MRPGFNGRRGAPSALSAGCAKSRLPAPPAAPDVSGRLAQAGALMRTGCFDCLEEALAEYEAVRDVPNLRPGDFDAATDGAIRSALLLELRQRELGMADDGYLQRARNLIGTRPDRAAAFAPHLYTVESIPRRDARFARGRRPRRPAPDAGAAREVSRRSSRSGARARMPIRWRLTHGWRSIARTAAAATIDPSRRCSARCRSCATRRSSGIARPPVRGPSRNR